MRVNWRKKDASHDLSEITVKPSIKALVFLPTRDVD
jgi:hypothetical protein